MKFTQAMFFGLALIVGVGIGYMFNPSVEEEMAQKQARPARGAVRDEGDAASISALRARIAELESELAKRGERSESKVAEAGKADKRRDARGPFVGMSPKEWREKMKKENPQQYAQMTNGIARWRRERLERAQKKVDFLSSIDVSRMSASARKTHGELQDLIARREELEQKMHEVMESDTASEEDRRAMFREMHDVDRQIRELNSTERENLMLETVKNLGFDESEAGEVTEAFQTIIENTEGGFGSTGRPRGEGPGGPGGPGGGLPPPGN